MDVPGEIKVAKLENGPFSFFLLSPSYEKAGLVCRVFLLPFLIPIGLEAVIFIGGVSLGQSATSIPIAAIVGLICGTIAGFVIYQFGSRTS